MCELPRVREEGGLEYFSGELGSGRGAVADRSEFGSEPGACFAGGGGGVLGLGRNSGEAGPAHRLGGLLELCFLHYNKELTTTLI